MRLRELTGLTTPIADRKFKDENNKEYTFDELVDCLCLSRYQIDNTIRFMKTGEHRTINNLIIQRIDAE